MSSYVEGICGDQTCETTKLLPRTATKTQRLRNLLWSVPERVQQANCQLFVARFPKPTHSQIIPNRVEIVNMYTNTKTIQ